MATSLCAQGVVTVQMDADVGPCGRYPTAPVRMGCVTATDISNKCLRARRLNVLTLVREN